MIVPASQTERPRPTCLFFPGFMCDHRLFEAQALDLEARGFPVVHAGTAQIETLDQVARDAVSEIDRPFIAIGLSMGAILAMEAAKAAPDRITGLILMDCNPWPDDTAATEGRLRHLQAAGRGEIDDAMQQELIPLYCHDGPNRAATEALCLGMARDLGPAAFVSQTKALAGRGDQIEALRRVRVPTLIVTGSHDRVCPMDRHQAVLDAVPNSHLTIIEGAGHLPTLERPKETTRVLSDWVRSL